MADNIERTENADVVIKTSDGNVLIFDDVTAEVKK
jgi:hypothetical protein